MLVAVIVAIHGRLLLLVLLATITRTITSITTSFTTDSSPTTATIVLQVLLLLLLLLHVELLPLNPHQNSLLLLLVEVLLLLNPHPQLLQDDLLNLQHPIIEGRHLLLDHTTMMNTKNNSFIKSPQK